MKRHMAFAPLSVSKNSSTSPPSVEDCRSLAYLAHGRASSLTTFQLVTDRIYTRYPIPFAFDTCPALESCGRLIALSFTRFPFLLSCCVRWDSEGSVGLILSPFPSNADGFSWLWVALFREHVVQNIGNAYDYGSPCWFVRILSMFPSSCGVLCCSVTHGVYSLNWDY